MTIPDLSSVLEELWQLALTVASLKYIAGMVEQELETIQAAIGETRQDPHRPEDSEDVTADHWNEDTEPDHDTTLSHFLTLQEGNQSPTSGLTFSMVSYELEDITETEEDVVETEENITDTEEDIMGTDEDITEIQEDITDTNGAPDAVALQATRPSHLSSMTSHHLPDTDFHPGTFPLVSLSCSHLLSLQTDDSPSAVSVSMLVHQAPETSEGATETSTRNMISENTTITPVDDPNIAGIESSPSMVTHEVTSSGEVTHTEEVTLSMTAHSLLTTEEQDTGTLPSMVTHQILLLDSGDRSIGVTDSPKYEESNSIQEERDCIFSSSGTHQVTTEDTTHHLLSMAAHSLLSIEEQDTGTLPSMATHQILLPNCADYSPKAGGNSDCDPESRDGVLPSTITHHVAMVTEDPRKPLLSMATHSLLTTEEQDTGTLLSMVTHQTLLLDSQHSEDGITDTDTTMSEESISIQDGRDCLFSSSVTHQVTNDDPSHHLLSMTAHSLLTTEEQDTDTIPSMVTHQTRLVDIVDCWHPDTDSPRYREQAIGYQDNGENVIHSSVTHQVATEDPRQSLPFMPEDRKPSLLSVTAESHQDILLSSILKVQDDTSTIPSEKEMARQEGVPFTVVEALADTTEEKQDEDNLEYEEEIFSSASSSQGSTITSEVTEPIPLNAHDLCLETSPPFQKLSKAARRRRRRKLQKWRRTQEILLDDLEDGRRIMEAPRPEYLCSMVSHQLTAKESEIEDFPCSMVVHWDTPVEDEEGGMVASLVSHQPVVWAQEVERAGNTVLETVDDIVLETVDDIVLETVDDIVLETVEDITAETVEASLLETIEDIVLETVEDIIPEHAEDISSETPEYIPVEDGPISPAILATPVLQTHLFESSSPPRTKEKLRKFQKVSRLQRLRRTQERLEDQERSQSPSLIGSLVTLEDSEEGREWIEDIIMDVDQDTNMDPGAASEESMSPPSLPFIESPVDIPNIDYVEKSFDTFMEASKKTYNDKMASEHKSTIERIQELQKVVEEEIGNFEMERIEYGTSPLERTVLSSVRGISFPLQISIYNTESKEQTGSSKEGNEDNLKEDSFENRFAQSKNIDETEEEIVEEYNPKLNLAQFKNTEETKEQIVEEDKSANQFAQFKDAEVSEEEIIEENNSEDIFSQLKNKEEIKQGNAEEDKLEDKSLQLEDTEDTERDNDNQRKSEDKEDTSLSVVTASSSLDDTLSVAIKASPDNKESDSGFEGSPDIRNQEADAKLTVTKELSRYHFRRQSSLGRNTEEIKIRDKELLESFLNNENHEKKEDKAESDSPVREMAPGLNDTGRIPQVPLPTLVTNSEQHQEKGIKQKITSAVFKENIMRRTYKIRFKVNMAQVTNSEPEKPTIIRSLLNFFKNYSVFGRK